MSKEYYTIIYRERERVEELSPRGQIHDGVLSTSGILDLRLLLLNWGDETSLSYSS